MSTIYEVEAMQRNLQDQFSELLQIVENSIGTSELHDLEKSVFENLQGLGLSLLEYFVAQSGTGYEPEKQLKSENGKMLEYKGTTKSPYFSIFGEIRIERARYKAQEGKYYYPLDAKLNLPEKKYSYLLQKWFQAGAVETNYQESVEHLNEIFDHCFFPSMPQRIGQKLSESVDDFYEQLQPPDEQTEGSHLAISADGKGIRIIKSERDKSAQNQTPKVRLGKGERPGLKKEAVVTADFSFNPVPRSPEEIVQSLMKERKQPAQKPKNKPEEKPRSALNKHLRATLSGKQDAMNYLMKRLLKRNPNGNKPVIALIDGDLNLRKAVEKAFQEHRLRKRLDTIILDIIHVTEYVWDVGTALHGERSAERIPWVREKLLTILESKVGRVIGGFKQMLTKNKVTVSQRKALQKAISYFENHRDMMDYKVYLEKGYPIATGLVEGACNSLVKNRMEQSGMRWTITGATSILKQRAVKLNGDWNTFWEHHMNSQRAILYPDSYKIAA